MKTFNDIDAQDEAARAAIRRPNALLKDSYARFLVMETARQNEHTELLVVLNRIADALEQR